MARIATGPRYFWLVLALILLLAVSQGNASRPGNLHAQGVIDNRVGSTALSGTRYIVGLDTMGTSYVTVDFIRDDVLIFNSDWTLDRFFPLSPDNTFPVGLAYDGTYIHVLDASAGLRRIHSYAPSGTPASPASFPISGDGQGIDWAGSHFRIPTDGLMTFYDGLGTASSAEQFPLVSPDTPTGATSDGTYQYVLYPHHVDIYESGTYRAALGFALGEGCVGNGITYDGTHLQVMCSHSGTSRVETYSPITVPGRVTATLGISTATSMTFSWTEPAVVAPVTDYHIEYRVGISSPWTNWPHGGNVRRATITSLSASTTYYVQVRAVNIAGAGNWSLGLSGATLAPEATPTPDPSATPTPTPGFVTTQVAVDGGGFTTQAPKILTFHAVDDGPNVSGTLTWEGVPYANSYQLELLAEDTTYHYISNDIRAEYSLTLGAPPSGQSNFAVFRVRARLTTAESPDPIRGDDRVIILPANATLWGPWSEPYSTPYQRGGGLSVLDTEATPTEVGGTHPGLIALVGEGTRLVGMSPALNGLLAALGWIALSLLIGGAVAKAGDLTAPAMMLGCALAASMLLIGGPQLAGIPWEWAALICMIPVMAGAFTLQRSMR